MDAIETNTAGLLVLADVADNAGGGAPSDSTFLLQALLQRGLGNVVSGYYWDPIAVRFCEEAGEGVRLTLRIGGKCGKTAGKSSKGVHPAGIHIRSKTNIDECSSCECGIEYVSPKPAENHLSK